MKPVIKSWSFAVLGAAGLVAAMMLVSVATPASEARAQYFKIPDIKGEAEANPSEADRARRQGQSGEVQAPEDEAQPGLLVPAIQKDSPPPPPPQPNQSDDNAAAGAQDQPRTRRPR